MSGSEPEETSVPMVRADPRHRRLLVWSILLLVVLVGSLAVTVAPYAEAWVEAYEAGIATKSPEELRHDYRLLAVVASLGLVVPLSIVACAFLYQSYRVHRAERHPYPGMMLLRDTPLEIGARARRRSRRLLIAGISLLTAGWLMASYLFSRLMRLLDSL
jgi:hypothetical protein